MAEPARRLLIVDESAELREVLRTVLEARGIEILEAAEARQGLEMLAEFHPDVVVLDLDCEALQPGEAGRGEAHQQGETTNRGDIQDEYARLGGEHLPLVLLGRVAATPQQARVFSKPYHYGPLVRTIEQLFFERGTLARRPS